MFLFGLKMLWDAYRMKPDEMAGIQAEVEEELQRRGSVASTASNPNANANNGRDVEMQAQQEPLNQDNGEEQTNDNGKRRHPAECQTLIVE